MKIRKGDKVKILYGKETGKTGIVSAVSPKKDAVVVEGLNLYKRHLKGDGKTRTSEIVEVERPYKVSKVMFICPLCGKATRLVIKKEDKKIIRICKKCGKEIPAVEEKKVETKKTVNKENKKETKKKGDNNK